MSALITHNPKIILAALQQGKVVAFPTDTVYGLGVDASNRVAVERLYEVKGRDRNQPLQVLVSSLEQAQRIAEFSPKALVVAKHFWPGALTMVLPRKSSALVTEAVSGDRQTIGLRWPDADHLIELLQELGKPIAASSANRGGEAPLTTAREIAAQLPVACVLEAVESLSGQASTVVEIRDEELKILREGSISQSALKNAF